MQGIGRRLEMAKTRAKRMRNDEGLIWESNLRALLAALHRHCPLPTGFLSHLRLLTTFIARR